MRKTPIHCAFGTYQIPAFWPFFDGPANVCFKRTLECALPDVVPYLCPARAGFLSRLRKQPTKRDETRQTSLSSSLSERCYKLPWLYMRPDAQSETVKERIVERWAYVSWLAGFGAGDQYFRDQRSGSERQKENVKDTADDAANRADDTRTRRRRPTDAGIEERRRWHGVRGPARFAASFSLHESIHMLPSSRF
ncbi:hypothetical protein AWB67_06448 [Caballeronia terrestris]|uniref:Uncharacterized protein n=1 Tax=Caballeronia terrestris TaxID=1226301 RepID=A0A158KR15_9BURK|nr:hypothetical protein AWB67_06448 [Caballeronia terrestris]